MRRIAVGLGLALVLVAATALGRLVPEADAGKKRTYVYVHDDAAPQRIFAFAMAKDGTLSPVTGSPFFASSEGNGCGGDCETLSYSKKRKMLFHGGADGLTVWKVSKDGTLAEVAGSPFAADSDSLWGTYVHERGNRVIVYATATDAARLHAFSIAKDGVATSLPDAPYATGEGPIGVAAAKQTLVVMNQSATPPSSFEIGKKGALSPIEGNAGTNDDDAWVLHPGPKGKFVYSGGGESLHTYRVDKKAHTVVRATEYDAFEAMTGNFVNGIVFSKKAPAFVWSFGGDGTNDLEPVRQQKDGSLIAVESGTQSTGVQSIGGIAFAANGRQLAVAGYGNDMLKTFAVDKKTGVLSELDAADLSDDPEDVTDLILIQR